MNNALNTEAPLATGGFTDTSFAAFLKGRDEPAWLIDRRRQAFARFQAFAWPSARGRMAADRHPGAQARRVRPPAPINPPATPVPRLMGSGTT